MSLCRADVSFESCSKTCEGVDKSLIVCPVIKRMVCKLRPISIFVYSSIGTRRFSSQTFPGKMSAHGGKTCGMQKNIQSIPPPFLRLRPSETAFYPYRAIIQDKGQGELLRVEKKLFSAINTFSLCVNYLAVLHYSHVLLLRVNKSSRCKIFMLAYSFRSRICRG